MSSSQTPTTVILRTTARIVVPITVLVALALFLQGHNAPGGGFIAGVLTAAALALVYISYGMDFLEERVLGRPPGERTGETVGHSVVADYRRLFALGLAVAAGAGLVPLLFGDPFMSQTYLVLHDVPVYHEVELASAVVFDLGVYAVVVGALLTILSVVGSE